MKLSTEKLKEMISGWISTPEARKNLKHHSTIERTVEGEVSRVSRVRNLVPRQARQLGPYERAPLHAMRINWQSDGSGVRGGTGEVSVRVVRSNMNIFLAYGSFYFGGDSPQVRRSFCSTW